MKKIILSLLLALSLIFTLAACELDAPKETGGGSKGSSITSQNKDENTPDKVISESPDTNASKAPEATNSKEPEVTYPITKEQAKAIALKNANASEDKVTRLKIEKDIDDGKEHYDIEFIFGGSEYEYEILISNGSILKAEKDDVSLLNPNTGSAKITLDEAKKTALAHAKVAQKDAAFLKAEYDGDDKVPHYDIEFKNGGYEYEYEINAETGKIIKSEKEKDD